MKSVIRFALLTYAVSWTCWLVAVRLARGAAASSALASALLLVGTFGPAIAALMVTWLSAGTRPVQALLARMLQWRIGWQWFFFAVLYLPVIKLAAAITYRWTTGAWHRFGHEGPLIIAIAILISTPVQAGEEIGWRGYMLPRLAVRIGLAPASLIVGVIWGVWHLPLFFLPGADKFGQSIPVYVLGVIALSVAISWLYARTDGSLLAAMLMHSAFNQSIGIVPDVLASGERPIFLGASLTFLLTVALMWGGAVYLLARMRKLEWPLLGNFAAAAKP